MKYRNNLILSNQFHEKNREINVELFSSNLISRKKFREINFSFNFTLHRYFSKMNYVNTFFSSFFIAEGLLQCFQDELREHIFSKLFRT